VAGESSSGTDTEDEANSDDSESTAEKKQKRKLRKATQRKEAKAVKAAKLIRRAEREAREAEGAASGATDPKKRRFLEESELSSRMFDKEAFRPAMEYIMMWVKEYANTLLLWADVLVNEVLVRHLFALFLSGDTRDAHEGMLMF